MPSKVDFRDEAERAVADEPDPALIPLRLVQACLTAAPVEGAGLSLSADLRVPLAASSTEVVAVERLQTTLGDGPCLTAARRHQALVADWDEIGRLWPMYHQQLSAQSVFRSICSVPVTLPGGPDIAVLDLYSTDPSASAFPDPARLEADIASPMAGLLADGLQTVSGTDTSAGSVWLENDVVHDRMTVWTAVGMLMSHMETRNDIALDVLRGYAFRTRTSLDQLARQLTDRQLRPEDVTASP